ncbi:MAG: acetyl-CoA decarbonylase/synthase complex subunit gamma [Chloroflexi bacterium]|nr:acetyl-CoA decarbonylase/synthase complex subunit gamma [Chloroflexota bacterium]
MALSGIQIYKLLPQTNCKECNFPTCLAFAMKLAAKQVELADCPYVSEESSAKLSAASQPPVRPMAVKSNGYEVKAGSETVLFRHERTFVNRPGLFLRVYDSESAEAIKAKVKPADNYAVDYVGIDLGMSGFAVQADGGDASPGSAQRFAAAVKAVREVSHKPIILIAGPEAIKAGLAELAEGEVPLLCCATAENWEAMAALAKGAKAALAVEAETIDELVALTTKVKDAGVQDIVLSPTQRSLKGSLTASTMMRRLALKKNFRPLGFPIISFPGDWGDVSREVVAAAQAIGKYSGFIVMDHFSPETAYPLLVLRENIYTDPQKPIQVTPGVYEINDPGPDDPVLVTTNFSITYFSVANEVEGSGNKAWMLVADAEGMSVLTAWAAGKFDAEVIAKDVKRFGVADKVNAKRIVLPGHVAVLSGELEEELPDWEVKVGPREAVDLPGYMKSVLN